MRRAVAASALVALVGVVAPARAEDRVAAIQATLDAGQAPSTRWWALWSAGFAAGTIGNGVASFAYGPGPERASARVQTVTSALAFTTTFVLPMPCRDAGLRLHAFVGDDAARAKEADRLLDECAEEEALKTGWLAHGSALVVDAAAGAWIAWHDGYPWYGLLAFLSGELVAEVQIATTPRGALHLREANLSQIDLSVAFAPTKGGGWLGLAGTF